MIYNTIFANNFNPRPHEEGDHNIDFTSCKNDISIHALMKRATSIMIYNTIFANNFNPRPHEEGDNKYNKVR